MRRIIEPVKERFLGRTIKVSPVRDNEGKGGSEGGREQGREDVGRAKMMKRTPPSLGVETGAPLEGNHAKTR